MVSRIVFAFYNGRAGLVPLVRQIIIALNGLGTTKLDLVGWFLPLSVIGAIKEAPSQLTCNLTGFSFSFEANPDEYYINVGSAGGPTSVIAVSQSGLETCCICCASARLPAFLSTTPVKSAPHSLQDGRNAFAHRSK